MLTPLQIKAIKGIVGVFEVGHPNSGYGTVTFIRGDRGRLTYGRHQTTIHTGNLHALIFDYASRQGAAHAAEFAPYIADLAARARRLDTDMALRLLLRRAAHDPVMIEAQDAFFQAHYWTPAIRSAAAIGAMTALGHAVVYDSTVHGSWARIRNRVNERFGRLSALGEAAWIGHYVDERRAWLASHVGEPLANTVYRMDALKALIRAGNWDLALPFDVRRKTLDRRAIGGAPYFPPFRRLKLGRPRMKGEDVGALQEALVLKGQQIFPDKDFGPATDRALRAYQRDHPDLSETGVANAATQKALDLTWF